MLFRSRSLKSELALDQRNIPRAIALITKNKENLPVHPSQPQTSNKDFSSSTGFTHPIHQYNNLGVIYLKMKKYALALTYFQAVSFIVFIGIQTPPFFKKSFASRCKSNRICVTIQIELYRRDFV